MAPRRNDGSSASRQSQLSMKSLYMVNAEDAHNGIIDHTINFAPDSMVHHTWGAPSVSGVQAPTKIRRRRGLGLLGIRRGRQSAIEKFMSGERLECGPLIPNSPERSHLLRLPLEIRWNIYKYILVQQDPILVYHDWISVRSHVLDKPSILFVCRQISQEAAPMLYKDNVFQAAICGARVLTATHTINIRFLPLLRNVVIGYAQDQWNKKVLKTTVNSLKALISANVLLDSLTFVLSPQRIAMRRTATGFDFQALTYSEWFHADSALVLALKSIRCAVLNIVMGLHDKKRVVFSIDLRHLPVNYHAEGEWAARDEVATHTRVSRAVRVKTEFRMLRARFERVFEHCDGAVAEGWARVMGEGEAVGDGLKLAIRGV